MQTSPAVLCTYLQYHDFRCTLTKGRLCRSSMRYHPGTDLTDSVAEELILSRIYLESISDNPLSRALSQPARSHSPRSFDACKPAWTPALSATCCTTVPVSSTRSSPRVWSALAASTVCETIAVSMACFALSDVPYGPRHVVVFYIFTAQGQNSPTGDLLD